MMAGLAQRSTSMPISDAGRAAEEERPAAVASSSACRSFQTRVALHDQAVADDQRRGLQRRQDVQPDRGGDQREGEACERPPPARRQRSRRETGRAGESCASIARSQTEASSAWMAGHLTGRLRIPVPRYSSRSAPRSIRRNAAAVRIRRSPVGGGFASLLRCMANKIDLGGKNAVVTGGAQGIGRAIVERLLDSGAAVAIWDRDQALAEKTAGELTQPRPGRGRRLDVTQARRGRARARRHGEGVRPHRHPGQQRRHRRAQRQDLGVRPGGLGRGDAGQSRQPVLLLPRHRAADDRAELRPHRQHRLDRRQGGQSERAGLFGVEGRRDRADQIARQGARELRHRGQLRHAGRGADRDLRPDDASSTSTTCCRKSRAAASSRSTRSPRWWRSAPRPTARSPPARCSTFPAGGRPIDRSRARATPPAADRHRADVRRGAVLRLPRLPWRNISAGHMDTLAGGRRALRQRIPDRADVLQSDHPAGPAARPRGRALQLVRSALLLGSTVFNFMAFRYLQLDEALAILFSTPFLVAILAGPHARRMGRLAALDRDRGRLRRRAGGGAARASAACNGRRCSRSAARSATPATASPPACCRAPIPARPRCSTPTCSAAW